MNWGGKDQIPLKVTLHWSPGQAMRDALAKEYNKRLDRLFRREGTAVQGSLLRGGARAHQARQQASSRDPPKFCVKKNGPLSIAL